MSTPGLSAQSSPLFHSAFDYSPSPVKKTLIPELIAVSGSQYDNSSGNKMMFIGQAVRELAELKRSQPALTRTLVVFTPSYSNAMLSAIRRSASAYEARVIAVTSTQGLIDYIHHGKDRKQSPIERLALFSHCVPQRIQEPALSLLKPK